jgi:preprotein translocase subunit SecY
MAKSSNAAAGLGGGLGKFTELRQRLLFVVGALMVYRIGCYIRCRASIRMPCWNS